MAFDKITEEDLKDKGVRGLPDIPQLTTAEMQAKFEELETAVIIPKLNKLIDDLMAETAGESIGATVPDGFATEKNIQSILNEIAVIVLASKSVNTLLNEIKRISNTVSDDATALATCKAVYDYVVQMGGGDVMQSDLTDTVPYNLIPFPYYSMSGTTAGVQYATDEEGVVNVNGTSTAQVASTVTIATKLPLTSGTYTLSGAPSTSDECCRLRVGKGEDSAFAGLDSGKGVTFTLEEDTTITIILQVIAGTTVENLTFKPMLVKGDTAKEYHKSFRSVYEQQKAIIDDLEEIEATTEAGLPAGALAVKALLMKLCGCWIAFEDEEGNPTTEPYIHWLAEEEEASE